MAAVASRTRTITLWTFKALLAVVFVWAAYGKLAGQPKMVTEFDAIGLGQGFRFVAGATELLGAALLICPASAFFGAIVLLGICAGAFVSQIVVLHNDLIHVVVMTLMLCALAWDSRPAWLRRV
jgi:putative oxidoreductase